MKEIRLHGRGGQGVVKSAQIIVQTVIDSGLYAHFIPFFGVERKGSPVFGFLRIDDKDIRLKCQVYDPEILMIFDDTLIKMPQTFEGLRENSTVIINTTKDISQLNLPENSQNVYAVDATNIALESIKKPIPNTAMLGAFAKATNLVDWDTLQNFISEKFGEANRVAASIAYEKVQLISSMEKSNC